MHGKNQKPDVDYCVEEISYKYEKHGHGKPRLLIFFGMYRTMPELAKIFGIKQSKIYARFSRHILRNTGRIKTVQELCSKKNMPQGEKSEGLEHESIKDHEAYKKMREILADPKGTAADIKPYQQLAYGIK